MNSEDEFITIHLWSAPRSMSTCTMYSFAQRNDTLVVDEPLYAHYLHRFPEIHRVYRDELLKVQNINGEEVLDNLGKTKDYLHAYPGKRIVFVKNIIKQLYGLNVKHIIGKGIINVFLIRDPIAMISSWEEKVAGSGNIENCSMHTIGFSLMLETFSEIKRLTGKTPLVIDSDLLRQYPKEILSELCAKIGIPFVENQLYWNPGPISEDGLWAPHWYDGVHSSTGFGYYVSKKSKRNPLSQDQLEIYRDVLPFYDSLRRHAIGMDKLCVNSSSPPLRFNQIGNSDNSRLADSRNENILIWVGNRILPRECASVSVFDSSVQGGDAVWEGIRVYNGHIFKLQEHLNRLMDSAKAMAYQNIPSIDFIKDAIIQILTVNNMYDSCHMRLTLTRGNKITSSMNPNFNLFGCTLIIIPEWKPVGDPATYDNAVGIKLVTSCIRRNSPQCIDSKIHHCNMINNILPKIQANLAKCEDALMLDLEGFVSETNATNVFIIKHNIVYTPHADYCLPGITRQTVIDLIKTIEGLNIIEKRLSLTEFYAADEVFTTGTMGELTPVIEIDGRVIGNGCSGEIFKQIQDHYRQLTFCKDKTPELM